MFGLGGAEFLIFLVVIVIPALLLYFLPTIIVVNNQTHNNKAGVIIVNTLLGFSFIGWVIALVWAFHKPQPVYPPAVVNQYAAPAPSPRVNDPPKKWRVQLFQGGAYLCEVAINSHPVVIGRNPEVDIQVNEPSMSGRHWSVVLTAGGVQVNDLGSTNGTWKNGRIKINTDVAAAGDWYQVGQVQLLVGQTAPS